MNNIKKNTLLLSTTALLALPMSANAQSLDYGAFSEMFGEPVTTSATGSPQRASEVPLNMEIVTADDLRRSGVLSAGDIPLALRSYAGMDVRQSTETHVEVGVRGYGSSYNDRILVLVNGRQVFLDYYGLVAWETIPVEIAEIRQIEVVKGPNTALFGFNAVSGVVNILTYNPLYDDVSKATVTVGTQNTKAVSIVKTFQLGEGGFRFSAGGYEIGEFDQPATANGGAAEALVQDGSERKSASFSGLIQTGESTQWGFELTRSDVERNESIVSSYAHQDYNSYSWKTNLIQEHETLGLIEASIYRNLVEVPSLGQEYNEVTVAQISDIFKIGNDHTIRLMGEYRDNRASVLGLPTNQSQYDVKSVGGLWTWAINSQFSLSNALRFDSMRFDFKGDIPAFVTGVTEADYDSKEVDELSINSGIVYKMNDDTTFRGTYARGVDIPSHLEISLESPFFIGTPAVEAAIITNYEIGVDHIFRNFHDTEFSASIFTQETEDVQGSDFNPAIGAFTFSNQGKTKARGFEVGFKGDIDIYRWGINYSRVDVEDSPNAAGKIIGSEGFNPDYKLSLNGGFTKDKWEGDVFVSFVDGYTSTNHAGFIGGANYEVDSEALLSARVAYQVRDNFNLALSGRNLNGDHYQTGAQELQPQVYLTGSLDF